MYVIYYKYSVVGHIKVYLFHMYMSYTRVPIEEDGSSVGTNDEAQICLHIIFYKYIPTSGWNAFYYYLIPRIKYNCF